MDNYKKLVCAIIQTRTEDYLYHKLEPIDSDSFYNFCMYNKWFEWLDLDREYYYFQARKKKEDIVNGYKHKKQKEKNK